MRSLKTSFSVLGRSCCLLGNNSRYVLNATYEYIFCGLTISTASSLATEKPAYNRDIRHCNIGTLGYHRHGKTTLSAAITKVLSDKQLCDLKSIDDIDNTPDEKKKGMSLRAKKIDYFTDKRHYAHWDCPGHKDYLKNAISPALQLNGAIFVASATDDDLEDTRDALLFAKNVGIKKMVVFINKVDISKTKLDDHAEMIKELLISSGFEEETPIVTGSALLALQDINDRIGKDSIINLLNALEKHIPNPEQFSHKSLVLPIDHVYTIKSQGTVVSGSIEQGTVKIGMEVELLGYGRQFLTKISSLEMFEKVIAEASGGDHAFALVSKIKRDDVCRGMVLCEPGTLKMHDHCEVEVDVLTTEDGGRGVELNHFYQPLVYCKTWDIPATMLTPDKSEVSPGKKARVILHLSKPMVFGVGSELVLFSTSQVVGTAIVRKFFPNLTENDKANIEKEKKQKKKDMKAKEKISEFNPRLA